MMSNIPQITSFFDDATNTISYLVSDPATRLAAVIDPVLDYDPSSGEVDTASAERILAAANEGGLDIVLVLETHAHADHLSGAPFFKAKTNARIGIGAQIRQVQKIFRPIFMADDLSSDGSDFDLLFDDGDVLDLGELTFKVIATPGHTPADISYWVGDAVFVGDTLFMPDFGTARTDFPGGDARQLYRSIQRLLALDPATRLFVCHDYRAPGREEFRWETSVGEQRERNIHVGGARSEQEFVTLREARDATLDTPHLLLPAIQVNIRAGRFPPAEANGVKFLRIPVKAKSRAAFTE